MTSGRQYTTYHLDPDFLACFTREHAFFQGYIQGHTSQAESSSLASLFLGRLMFLYFLQTKGVFGHNPDYLADVLQSEHTREPFFRHYHHLLQRIIPQGLTPHPSNIAIPDEAFTRILTFFTTYHWSLDAQPSCQSHSILPEALGLIFEKYLNQKQLGAYYTQTDVTNYISKNTLYPAILYALTQTQDNLFTSHGIIQHLLHTHPTRYISSSVKAKEALPRETDRDYANRQRRYNQIRDQLASGAITSVEDLITLNLDLSQLMQDLVLHCHDVITLQLLYETLSHITILDPACGSGAFLLTALDMLYSLYDACLTQMASIVQKTSGTAEQAHQQKASAFCREILSQVSAAPSQRSFIYTSIITHNLYGLDIMPEAVETCILTLYLKLAASINHPEDLVQLSPLRHNIRVGNALVGVTTAHEITSSARIPPEPQRQRSYYDQVLARIYGIKTDDQGAFQRWKRSHAPFHWPVEFPHVMNRGGFDVILGNPPYIEYSKVRSIYKMRGYETTSCGNLYAAMVERSLLLSHPQRSLLGLVVPLSICSGERFAQLRTTIKQHTNHLWLANFEIFPSRLFAGAFQRLSILLATRGSSHHATYVTRLQRWYAIERPHVINLISYTREQYAMKPATIPKLASPLHEHILYKAIQQGGCIANQLCTHQSDFYIYYQEATNYWVKAICHIPYYKKNGQLQVPTHGRILYFADEGTAHCIMAVMNSALFYLWFVTFSDGFHLSQTLVKQFPLPTSLLADQTLLQYALLLEEDIRRNALISTRNTKPGTQQSKAVHKIELEEFRMGKSKALLDTIDRVLAQHYALTHEEVDFVINYDLKYRMGQEIKNT